MKKENREMFVKGLVANATVDKGEVRQVNLNINGKDESCFVTSKRNESKTGTVVEVITLFGDDTYEVLAIDFVQNSLKTNNITCTTYEYIGPVLGQKTISERTMSQIDINKFTVNVNDYYVPLSVILTPYFKDKAKNAVMATAIKSLDLISMDRVNTKIKDRGNNKDFQISIFDNINLCVLDENKNIVNVDSMSNKKLNKLLNKDDNKRYFEIIASKVCYNKDNNRGDEEMKKGTENKVDTVETEVVTDKSKISKVERVVSGADTDNKNYNYFKDGSVDDMIDNYMLLVEKLKDATANIERIIATDNGTASKEYREKLENLIGSESNTEKFIETESKSDNKVETTLVVTNNVSYDINNKVFGGMVKYICDTQGDKGLVKYKEELTMIYNLLSKETIKNVAKTNKSIHDILTRYERNEIVESPVKGFDVVSELLDTLHKCVYKYEDLNKLAKLPIDVKVKLIYLLLEDEETELKDMTIENRSMMYVIFRNSLLRITREDMLQNNSSGDFSIAQAKTSVRNRAVVKKYIA